MASTFPCTNVNPQLFQLFLYVSFRLCLCDSCGANPRLNMSSCFLPTKTCFAHTHTHEPIHNMFVANFQYSVPCARRRTRHRITWHVEWSLDACLCFMLQLTFCHLFRFVRLFRLDVVWCSCLRCVCSTGSQCSILAEDNGDAHRRHKHNATI